MLLRGETEISRASSMAHRIATNVPAMDEWVCWRGDGKEAREREREQVLVAEGGCWEI